jgi:hypothetical protein
MLGWPFVHYLHGSVSGSLFILWFFLYTDQPANNKFVSAKELLTIHEGKSEAHRKHTGKIPYWVRLTDGICGGFPLNGKSIQQISPWV